MPTITPKGGVTKFERLNASMAINNGSVVNNDFYVEERGLSLREAACKFNKRAIAARSCFRRSAL